MNGVRILSRRDVESVLGWDECIDAVERAFRLHAAGRSLSPGVLGVRAPGGGFHIKAAGLELGRPYFAVKTNGNFPQNPRLRGLPAIQGVILLCDAGDGRPLAVMDSMELTLRRTAAATAVAARYLARPDSKTVTVCGCGIQGRAQLRALTRVLPLQRAWAFDTDPASAEGFAAEMTAALGFEVAVALELAPALERSDVCVTCTPSRSAFLMKEHVRPGTFVAAVGADNSEKQELDPRLMKAAVVVTDVLDQCAAIGDLHHAVAAGVMAPGDVYAELAELVSGAKPPRRERDAVTVFDSTGTALEDVAAAAVAYENALAGGVGLTIALGD